MREILLRLLRKKKIRCVRCKQLKTVSKSWHWLKPCPNCLKHIAQLEQRIREGFGLTEE